MNPELKALDLMPIKTYGTTLLGAYAKMLKLTNTKTSDKKNGRTKAQSFNSGRNAILQATFYIPTVRQRTLACHTEKGKVGGFYPTAHLKDHIMQLPCILVWFWDSRFTKLLVDKKLGTLPVSMHFAEKHGIRNIELEYGRYNPEDTEITLEHKDLRPVPDYIILPYLLSRNNQHIIEDIFFPDARGVLRFIFAEHSLLANSRNSFEKYVSSEREIEYKLRLLIYKDLISRNDIPRDWNGWLNKIRFFMNEGRNLKIGARM